jgi:hypothetical protein
MKTFLLSAIFIMSWQAYSSTSVVEQSYLQIKKAVLEESKSPGLCGEITWIVHQPYIENKFYFSVNNGTVQKEDTYKIPHKDAVKGLVSHILKIDKDDLEKVNWQTSNGFTVESNIAAMANDRYLICFNYNEESLDAKKKVIKEVAGGFFLYRLDDSSMGLLVDADSDEE